MNTIAKDVKQHSKRIQNIEELKIIAERYAAVKNYVYSRYSGINGINILDRYKEKIRNEWVKTKFANQWGLSARYWKSALDEGISNIKTKWSNTKNRIKEAVRKNENITEEERHFIYYVIKANQIYEAILTYKEFIKPNKIQGLNIREEYIYNLIRRYTRKYKGSIPISRKKRSFMIDADMYEYKTKEKENVIEIAGIKKNCRIGIVLKDKNVHKGNLRVVIENDSLVVIHRMKKVEVKVNKNKEYILAVDKGYTSMLAASSGRFYGEELGKYLTEETERLNTVNAKRNQVWALIDKYNNEENKEKAEIIRKNNFGKIKYNRKKNKYNEKVKSYINHEIKIMFDEEKPTELVVENLDFINWTKKLPPKIKRKLSRWIKGYIEERLEYIAALRQIKITTINPAYTSQVCHKCGAIGDRNGKIFTCKSCGKIDADYNAACNIGNRKNDTEITLYTPYKKVKEILRNRYELKIATI